MASVKVKYRPSSVADREGRIYYQIIHERTTRQLLTDYRLYPTEWDCSKSTIVNTRQSDRHFYLSTLQERIKNDLNRPNI